MPVPAAAACSIAAEASASLPCNARSLSRAAPGPSWRCTAPASLTPDQNRPHYADPISCPVLAVGAQAYLGDQVVAQLAQVARDVRGAVVPRPVTTSRWKS